MSLNQKQTRYFLTIAEEVIYDEMYQKMKQFIQHGRISTYDHSISVAYYSYYISQKLHLKLNTKSLIIGALLHDFYLYDWHHKHDSHKWHGFHHAKKAKQNALLHYQINTVEQHIIESHMWPLTLRSYPSSKEALVVCGVDKVVSLLESFRFKQNIIKKIKES